MTVPWFVNLFSRAQRERRVAPYYPTVTARLSGWLVMPLVAWLSVGGALGATNTPKATIDSVSVSRPFFNPSLGQTIRISFAVAPGGALTVLVLDRDGFPVRVLASKQAVQAGNIAFDWDGKNDLGAVVADEAYSLKIDLFSAGGSRTYFPAQSAPTDVAAKDLRYDRSTAVFSYQLAKPSRVHLQAGLAPRDAKTGKRDGPVLKTVVNREPRPGGAVVETWNGLDQTGAYYVPDLPDFVVGIAATSLPENALIAVGNKDQTFLERAVSRSGVSLLTPAPVSHAHHRGLNALEDASPTLSAKVANAVQSHLDHSWSAVGASLKGSLALEGPSAPGFLKQPGALRVFIDTRPILTDKSPVAGMKFDIPMVDLSPGEHIVAFNWGSEYGPVAVTSLRIRVEPPGKPALEAGRR